jgi:tRNA(Arg) A34 adenosine deaminase TadA
MDDRPVPPGLAPFWNGTVASFATLPSSPLPEEMKERHRIYSLLLMSLVESQWNGNKYGEKGDYGSWRASQELACLPGGQKLYQGGTYLGHNIAALAVDGEGRIMDFDFNHNEVFDSSVEHAESRLVRRLFALNDIYEPWGSGRAAANAGAMSASLRSLRPAQRRNVFATAVHEGPLEQKGLHASQPVPYGNLLKDVTIYTSLESCAQCSGIMTLASVKEIVYLQWDQGQFLVGNMMWQATSAQKLGFVAPRPIRGDEFDFDFFAALNQANDDFSAKVPQSPFFVDSNGKVVKTPSVTSFLCTDAARDIFRAARNQLTGGTKLMSPGFTPSQSGYSNREVLAEAVDYLDWAVRLNNRGTPHRV